MSEESVEREAGSCFVIHRSGKTGPFRPRWKHPTLKTRLAIACGGGQAYIVGRAGVHNGNSGLSEPKGGHALTSIGGGMGILTGQETA